MTKNRSSLDQAVLLGCIASGAKAATARNDEGGYGAGRVMSFGGHGYWSCMRFGDSRRRRDRQAPKGCGKGAAMTQCNIRKGLLRSCSNVQ
jgi:hypothetical protein